MLSATAAIEFGTVPPGGSATRTFTVRNTDTVPTSQLKLRIGLCEPRLEPDPNAAVSCLVFTDGTGFKVDPASLDLGAGQEADVKLTFTTGAPGHRSVIITLVGTTPWPRAAIHMLAHAYDGAGAGTGPLPVASPLFYSDLFANTQGIFPNGERFVADNSVHTCQNPAIGQPGDLCIHDADCVTAGEVCALSGVCRSGERAGAPCSLANECPGGFCTAALPSSPSTCAATVRGALPPERRGHVHRPELRSRYRAHRHRHAARVRPRPGTAPSPNSSPTRPKRRRRWPATAPRQVRGAASTWPSSTTSRACRAASVTRGNRSPWCARVEAANRGRAADRLCQRHARLRGLRAGEDLQVTPDGGAVLRASAWAGCIASGRVPS